MTKKRNPLPSRAQLVLDFPAIFAYTGTQADYPPRHFTIVSIAAFAINAKSRWAAGFFRGGSVKFKEHATMSILLPTDSKHKCINVRMGLSDNFDGLFAFTGGVTC